MSNDPIQPERRPLPYPGEPPHRQPEADPYAPAFGEASDPKKAKGRLLMPGIFILLIGVLNLVPGVGCVGIGFAMNSFSDAQMEQIITQQNPKQWDELQEQGWTAQSFKKIYLYSGLGCGGGSLLLALVAIIGGGCMIAGRSLFLCSMGALAAILSPGGFGILGLAIGIWAMVVLFSEDVRNAFRAA